MILRGIRWCLGYVRFGIAGRSPERFLTLAAREGYVLWDIAKTDTGHQAKVSVRQYRRLWSAAKKSGVRLRVEKRHGFPFVWHACRDKRGIFYGTVGAVAILILLSMRVWCIDVEGNETLSAYEIKQAAAECGLYPGMPKSQLEPRLVQQRLMARFPQIGWVAVNTWGNTAKIRLEEGIAIPEIEDTEKPTNVLSSMHGQILAMDVYHGVAEVKIGDAVAKGQLLVGGVLQSTEGGESFVHASAKIIAQTRRVFVMEVPLKQVQEQASGETVLRRSLSIFGAELPLSFQGEPQAPYTRTLETKSLVIHGVELPVAVCEETFALKQPVTVTLSKEQARQKALKEIRKKQDEVLKDGKVQSFVEREQTEGGVYRLEMECVCEENIAVEQEIFVGTDSVL